MEAGIRIEPLGDHEYLVTFPVGAEAVLTTFRATAGTLGKLGPAGTDEARIVAETATYLAEHQPLFDIPPMIDLDDVEAAYGGDYLQVVTGRLSAA